MRNGIYDRKKQELGRMILAYSLFLEEGMDAVERMYPEYKSFVLSHKGKSVTDVKNELLHSYMTC